MTSAPKKFFSQAYRDIVVRNVIANLCIVRNPDFYPYSEADVSCMSDENLINLAYQLSMITSIVQDDSSIRIDG